VRSLVTHSDIVLFGAACPGQPGQQHINCQWPEWWQKIFNSYGYLCDDSFRWKIWDDRRIEPWYRQNTFLARSDATKAGTEARLPPVVHPDMMRVMMGIGYYLPSGLAARLRSIRATLQKYARFRRN